MKVQEIKYKNGQLKSRFNVLNSYKEGLEMNYYESGNIKSIYQYKQGFLEGKQIEFFNKLERIPQLKYTCIQNKKCNLVESFYESGNLEFSYQVVDDIQNGPYEQYFDLAKKQVKIQGVVLNNQLHGLVKIYRESGTIKSEQNYKNGQLCGECTSYYKTGEIKKIENYVENQRCGTSKELYKSGLLHIERFYNMNIQEGIQQEFYENGIIKQYAVIENDCDIEVINYDVNGIKTDSTDLKNNVIYFNEDGTVESTYENSTGLFISRYKSGQPYKQVHYKDNVLHGAFTVMSEQNQLLYECTYKNGKMQGIERKYLDNGSLYKEICYHKGNKHGISKTYSQTQIIHHVYRKNKCISTQIEEIICDKQECQIDSRVNNTNIHRWQDQYLFINPKDDYRDSKIKFNSYVLDNYKYLIDLAKLYQLGTETLYKDIYHVFSDFKSLFILINESTKKTVIIDLLTVNLNNIVIRLVERQAFIDDIGSLSYSNHVKHIQQQLLLIDHVQVSKYIELDLITLKKAYKQQYKLLKQYLNLEANNK